MLLARVSTLTIWEQLDGWSPKTWFHSMQFVSSVEKLTFFWARSSNWQSTCFAHRILVVGSNPTESTNFLQKRVEFLPSPHYLFI